MSMHDVRNELHTLIQLCAVILESMEDEYRNIPDSNDDIEARRKRHVSATITGVMMVRDMIQIRLDASVREHIAITDPPVGSVVAEDGKDD